MILVTICFESGEDGLDVTLMAHPRCAENVAESSDKSRMRKCGARRAAGLVPAKLRKFCLLNPRFFRISGSLDLCSVT
jgi:hypothetical protein